MLEAESLPYKVVFRLRMSACEKEANTRPAKIFREN